MGTLSALQELRPPPGDLCLTAICSQLKSGPHSISPDGQVTVQYVQDNGAVIPVRVHTIVISVQHNEDITLEAMREALKEQVIKAVVPAKYLDEDTIYHLQPSGRFVIGGPQVGICLWMRPHSSLGLDACTARVPVYRDERCRSKYLSSVCPRSKCGLWQTW